MPFQDYLKGISFLLLVILVLNPGVSEGRRRKSKNRDYQSDGTYSGQSTRNLKGTNVCGPLNKRRCCPGWSLPPGGRRCILPVCSGGCGVGGICMRPSLCLCSNRELAPYCRPSGQSGAASLCEPQCQNGGICVARNLCRCPSGFSGGTCENDLRTGPCYMQLADRKCRGQLTGVVCTKYLCCATIGMAWGEPCEECPASPHPCRRGYIPNLDRNTCQDIDECEAIPGLCVSGKCVNTVGSYICECQAGQRRHPVSGVCEDINECLEQRDICAGGQCTNTEGSYFCTCGPGYESLPDRSRCIAVRVKSCYTRITNSKCTSGLTQLMSFTDCCCGIGKGWGDEDLCQLCPERNTDSYSRLCHSSQPYRRNECVDFPNLCKNGRCVDTDYSYRCECYAGFSLTPSGQECVDVDECRIQSGLCLNGQCINTAGSFECDCNEGFVLSSSARYCTDMNECEKTNMCPNGKCINMDGSYKCHCDRGYKQSPNQQVCLDIDECNENGRLCFNGRCMNTPGSYRCVCNQGYKLSPDGAFCLDENECEKSGMCANGMCKNMDGSYKCVCNTGYTLAPTQNVCIDIDECSSQSGVCVGGECINNQGSFRCECPRGFTLGPDRRTCLDTRKDLCFLQYRRGQCSSPSPMVVTKSQCCCAMDSMDAPGLAWGVSCEACPIMSDVNYKALCKHGSGMDYNGGEINQCALNPDICENGSCENTRRGYRCICNAGYRVDSSGRRCLNINECIENARLCDGGQCRDTPGSYTCVCPSGTRFDNLNKICEDIDECQSSPCRGDGTCVNLVGSYKCVCPGGYVLDASQTICIDERVGSCWMEINNGQCENNVKRLMLKSECCNTLGKAWGSPCEQCQRSSLCQAGYYYKDDGCKDVNECLLYGDVCRGGGRCVNTEGSFTCQCPTGMQLDSTGLKCIDTRKSTCFLDYSRGMCGRGLTGLFTRSKCCCSVGRAWSQECEPCPSQGSDQYKTLCSPDTDLSAIEINECREIPGICTNGVCRNTKESFTCTCDAGYALDARGINCTDIDECRISYGICENGACVNTPGAFICRCNPGYLPVMMEQMCMDIDECAEDQSLCRGGTCTNTPGSYRCQCPDGLELNTEGTACIDVDECSESSSICSNGYCENFMGGYQCTCHPGYKSNEQRKTCVDIDECSENNGGCDMFCVNSPGSFSCGCETGFTLMPDGKTCKDYNECREDGNICNGGKCHNIPGGYRCTCKDGLIPSEDMKQCIDIDECSGSRRMCENGRCENTHGSYRCVCDTGYTLDNNRCIDLDECTTDKHRCDSDARCLNLDGSYRCECLPGFEGDGFSCRDINECNREGVCSTDAQCINKEGSFSCICYEGFTGDGFNCRDVNECGLDATLCNNGRCENYPGGYRCRCDQGFTSASGDTSCDDIDECALFSNLCVYGQCENLLGSFKCRCDQGFKVDETGGNCTDLNECENEENCLYGECINSIGSYRCTCPSGFTLNPSGNGCIDMRRGFCYMDVRRQPRTGQCYRVIGENSLRASCCCSIGKGWGERDGYCDLCPLNDTVEYETLCPAQTGFRPNPDTLLPEDIDECSEVAGICKNGQCINTFGSYKCICPQGYRLNTYTQECMDVDECQEFPDFCAPGRCVNQPGNFTCICPDGYMPMPGEGCMDMRKDVCYAAYYNRSVTRGKPRCDHPLSSLVTKRQCCCRSSVGEGWGTPCEPCPVENSREYLELCKPLPITESTNECEIYQFLCENGRCIDTNTEEGFLCECGQGFVYNPESKRCDDVNECEASRNPCRGNAYCVNTVGSYRCQCPPGYDLVDGRRCQDIDECRTTSGICANGECVNLDGAFMCRCRDGFQLSARRDACLDIDECRLQPGFCGNGTCENTDGSFKCHCQSGFKLGDNGDCEDIDECREYIGICMNARCTNTPGSFSCNCLPGYTLSSDGMNCRDLDECSEVSGLCRNGRCTNTDGSYQCTCFDGYRLTRNGDSCRDINECRTIEGLCSNGRCINEEGSFRCECPSGYILTDDKNHCIDMRQGNCFREFVRGRCLNPRQVNMTLVQCCCTSGAAWSHHGSELCEVCPIRGEPSYAELCLDDQGRIITPGGEQDLNECMLDPDLCQNGRCINTDGSFRCECSPGYVLDSTRRQCVDNNECLTHGICGEGVCTNTVGSFTCRCRPGFTPGPNEVCEDINECETSLNQCVFRCANTRGSYKCICPMGFQVAADEIHCEDVDECLTPANNCRYMCKNLIGRFMCICPEGFRERGPDQCTDIDECREQRGLCGPGHCRNTQGGYRCICPQGYVLSSDGKRCLDRREDYCYMELVSRRCVTTSDVARTTQTHCCCSGGAAWGRRCDVCPKSGSDAYRQMCPSGPGFDDKGNDIDECRVYSGLCENGRCLNTLGSFRCVCNNGYKTDSTGSRCVDKDECLEGQSQCEDSCLNTIGSYRCTCGQGYVLDMDGRSCRDIDECSTGQHNCPQACVNTVGGFTCECADGYTKGRGGQCVDIDECASQFHLCTPGGRCSNTPGAYTCICNRGYKLDETGKYCIDIDECGDGQCENLCENSPGGFYCGCPEGFMEYWGQCIEIDVCSAAPCVYECTPAGQQYMCGCPPGYQMVGQDHCIQTISPSDYANMFPPGVQLPHEEGAGTGKVPDGEGCYSCNIGDKPLEVPLSKRAKRSGRGVVQDEGTPEWSKNHDDSSVNDTTFARMMERTHSITLQDLDMLPHKFQPRLLKVTKRAARRRKGSKVRRHQARRERRLMEMRQAAATTMTVAAPMPVYIDLGDVKRKTKLIKILPAISVLQGNIKYKIINRNDGLFFLRSKNGVNSLHAKRKKLAKNMSYHVNIEAVPKHLDKSVNGQNVHLGKSVFPFFVYTL